MIKLSIMIILVVILILGGIFYVVCEKNTIPYKVYVER